MKNTSTSGVFLDSEKIKKANEALYKQGEELAFRNKTLTLLDSLYTVATHALELEDVADRLTKEIVEAFGWSYCAIIYFQSMEHSFQMIGYNEKGDKQISFEKDRRVADLNYRGFSVLKNNTFLSILPCGEIIGPFFSNCDIKKHLKELRTMTTLVYPLSTENAPIGLLVIGVNRKEEQLNKFEKEGIGSTVNLVSVAIDKAAAYAQLKTANLKLQELDRQKTDFLSIASHQLRTPLSIMKGYMELIKDGGYGKPTKGIIETLDSMDSNNEHLIKLVDEFLDISRIEQGRTKFVFAVGDLVILSKDVQKELNIKAHGKHMKVEVVAKKDVVNVEMDEEKVRHVVYNFVDNAIKYSEEGAVTVFVENNDNGVAVRVCDQGLGFEKIDGVNFFQKFYRGENVKGINVTGNGLGLYVCKKFIEGHGGKVWAKSPGVGAGSEFGFWLPLKAVAPIAMVVDNPSIVDH